MDRYVLLFGRRRSLVWKVPLVAATVTLARNITVRKALRIKPPLARPAHHAPCLRCCAADFQLFFQQQPAYSTPWARLQSLNHLTGKLMEWLIVTAVAPAGLGTHHTTLWKNRLLLRPTSSEISLKGHVVCSSQELLATLDRTGADTSCYEDGDLTLTSYNFSKIVSKIVEILLNLLHRLTFRPRPKEWRFGNSCNVSLIKSTEISAIRLSECQCHRL